MPVRLAYDPDRDSSRRGQGVPPVRPAVPPAHRGAQGFRDMIHAFGDYAKALIDIFR